MTAFISLRTLFPVFLLSPFIFLLKFSLKLLGGIANSHVYLRTLLYLFIQFLVSCIIASIRSVTPLCVAYLAATITQTSWLHMLDRTHIHQILHVSYAIHVIIVTYAIFEIMFYIWMWKRSWLLQQRKKGPVFNNARRWLTFRRVEHAAQSICPMPMPANCVHTKRVKKHVDNHTSNIKSNNHTQLTTNSQQHADTHTVPHDSHPLSFLSGWFFNAPMEMVFHDNLMMFFAENSLGMHLSELSALQRDELEQTVEYVQRKLSGQRLSMRNKHSSHATNTSDVCIESIQKTITSTLCLTEIPSPTSTSSLASPSDSDTFSTTPSPSSPSAWHHHLSNGTLFPGYDPRFPPMQLNLAPVTYTHRPFMFYSIIYGIDMLCAIMLRRMGFIYYQQQKVHYWYRPPYCQSSSMPSFPAVDPLVFVHGIGIGLFSYIHFIPSLIQTQLRGQERAVFLIEVPYVAMKIVDNIPSTSDTVQCIADMLTIHSASSAVFVGHSYGTIISSWVIKQRPDIVSSVVLIDPVCFVLFDSSLAYNFLYRTPHSLVTSIYHFFVSTELGINYALKRHFYWYENVLWCEEIERIGLSPELIQLDLIRERQEAIESLPENQKRRMRERERERDRKRKEQSMKREMSTQTSSTHSDDDEHPMLSLSLSSPTCPASPPLSPLGSPHRASTVYNPGLSCSVFLAARDEIAPVHSIAKYLQAAIQEQTYKYGKGKENIELHVFDDMGHAESLFQSKSADLIIACIQSKTHRKSTPPPHSHSSSGVVDQYTHVQLRERSVYSNKLQWSEHQSLDTHSVTHAHVAHANSCINSTTTTRVHAQSTHSTSQTHEHHTCNTLVNQLDQLDQLINSTSLS